MDVFFDSVRERGVLSMQRCSACGHIRFPMNTICPRCLDPDFDWADLSGHGTVLSSVTFHRAYRPEWTDLVPYDVLFVELDEGPRMFSGPSTGEHFAVGDRVRMVPGEILAGDVVPLFTRAED